MSKILFTNLLKLTVAENKKNKLKKVGFELSSPEYGWIDFKLKIGKKAFECQFSNVFDPFEDLKIWLESLASGVQEASFIFDPEGTAVFFRFQKKAKKDFFMYEYNTDSLNVSSYDRETDLEGYVNRKQLVKSFYNVVINYSNSPEYLNHKYHWEYKTYKDFISKDLKISPKELKEKLLKYTRIKLINFIKIYQVETVFPEDEKEAEKRFNEQQLERLNKLIPLNYDEFSLEQKRKVIKKYLSGQYAFGTEPLKKFKSKIIEKYLKKKKHLP